MANKILNGQLYAGKSIAASRNDLDDIEPWDEEALQRVYSYLMSISSDYCFRIQSNDPKLTLLNVTNESDDSLRSWPRLDQVAYCTPTSASDWAKLGISAGNNSCLNTLILDYGDDDEEDFSETSREDLESFCSGLKLNRSIERLRIQSCNLFGKELFGMLTPFFEDNEALHDLTIENDGDGDYDIQTDALCSISMCLPRCKHITTLRFIECDMESEGLQLLSSGIKGCKTLTSISLVGVNALKHETGMGEEATEHFVEALHNHPGVVELSLCRNDIGRTNCFALLTILLESPDSKLEVLNLQDNAICATQAKMLADSLSTNKSLLTLNLSGNRITSTGWNSFSRLLCNTASIESTFLSNHTLQSLGAVRQRDGKRSADLTYNLKLNQCRYKGYVAHQKILRNHFNEQYAMAPLVNIELAVLPYLLSWIGNGRGKNGRNCLLWGHSALHYFLKNMPWLLLKQS